MEEKKEEVQAVEKPSYEQLEREVAGLKGMNNQLIMQINQLNMNNLFKRLDYLFKVVEFREAFNSDFVSKCTAEIEMGMTPADMPEEQPDKE